MRLDINPEAEKRFNELAEELRRCVQPLPRQPLTRERKGFEPAIVPSHTLTQEEIGYIPFSEETNPLTQATKRVIYDNGKQAFELPEEGGVLLSRLVDKLYRSSGFGKLVGSGMLREEVLLWINPLKPASRTLTEWLTERIAPRVRRYKAWVPISNLHVQSPLSFGRITFREIDAEIIDTWRQQWLLLKPDMRADIDEAFRERRERYQGLAAATIELDAEPERAMEIACQEAEKATALLRTFCIENLSPNACSYCVPIGRYSLLTDELFLFGPDGRVAMSQQMVLGPPPIPWIISDEDRPRLDEMGLRQLCDIISSSSLTDFQEKLLGALLAYNKANLIRDPVEKLVYVLVALETMLLRDQNEPIQANLGVRLAFVVGKDADERIRIAELVKRCYGMRSRFIHHGIALDDISLAGDFLLYVWVFFARLIRNNAQFVSKVALLDNLDRRKFE